MRRPEEALQRSVAAFLDVALPREAVWFHPPNGGARTKAEAGVFRATGVKPGVPDVVIIYRGRPLFIELKNPARRGHKNGGLSDAQVEMRERLTRAGAVYHVCYTLDEVIGFVRMMTETGDWG